MSFRVKIVPDDEAGMLTYTVRGHKGSFYCDLYEPGKTLPLRPPLGPFRTEKAANDAGRNARLNHIQSQTK
jgi:hypothetical protein